MNTQELEQRWKSISNSGSSPFRMLRISAECVSELSLALDVRGRRHLVLQVPAGIEVRCTSIEMENLNLEWHEETRFVLIGLRNIKFADLFNDLTISLYQKIWQMARPSEYTSEFISSFHKWTEFFDDALSRSLTLEEVKGLFGELIMLNHELQTADSVSANDVLNSWKGPYGNPQDFVFPSINLEVKTKDLDQSAVHISSEFQLQPQSGKGMQLAVVSVVRVDSGVNLRTLVDDIKGAIELRGADRGIFAKALSKAGLSREDSFASIDHLRWKVVSIEMYDCTSDPNFPKIVSSQVSNGISNVKYNLAVNVLDSYLIKKIEF